MGPTALPEADVAAQHLLVRARDLLDAMAEAGVLEWLRNGEDLRRLLADIRRQLGG
jgi:hypothetical protein